MAPRRSTLWLLCSLVLVCRLAQAEGKEGCAKARSALPSNTPHVDVSTLIKKIKRSTEKKREVESKNCDDDKKSKVGIQQSAVSAIPGQNETSKKKSSVVTSSSLTSTDEHEYLMLPNHQMNVQRNVLGIKRGNLYRKPTVRKSPLWSLSKLIEEVDAGAGLTAAKKNATPSVAERETNAEIHPKSEPIAEDKSAEKPTELSTIVKTNVATDPSKGIKATLSKAIEKVEKVIASRNAKLITPNNKPDENQSKRDNATETKEAPTDAAKETAPIVSGDAKNKTTTTNAAATESSKEGKNKKLGADPYAEIAAGPDRPKIPELKTGNIDENDSPVMKMNNGAGKQVAKDANGKPLTGQHDVGGLLDRLTDKLNKGGGGVAMDTSANMDEAASNNVKYVQSPMGLEDSAAAAPAPGGNELSSLAQDKQLQAYGLDKLKDQADHNDMEEMTEQEGLLAGSASHTASSPQAGGLDSLTQGGLDGTRTAQQSLARADGDSGLGGLGVLGGDANAADTSVAGGTEEDGMTKSLEKASSMTTNAIMDVLKSAKIPNSDEYSNADITSGPDPYALSNEQTEQQTSSEPVGSLFGGSNSDSNAIDAADPGTFTTGNSNEENDDTNSEARSLGTTSEEEESYQRNNIPVDSEQESRYRDQQSYRDRYNTELFKKHIIMRPKRDTYVSPFHDKEAFDTAI